MIFVSRAEIHNQIHIYYSIAIFQYFVKISVNLLYIHDINEFVSVS